MAGIGSIFQTINNSLYAATTGRNPVFAKAGNMVGWIPAYSATGRSVTFLPEYKALEATGGLFRYYDFLSQVQYILVAPVTGSVTPAAATPATVTPAVPATSTPAVPATPTPAAPAEELDTIDLFGKKVPVAYLAIGGAAVLALLVLKPGESGGRRR